MSCLVIQCPEHRSDPSESVAIGHIDYLSKVVSLLNDPRTCAHLSGIIYLTSNGRVDESTKVIGHPEKYIQDVVYTG